MALKKCKECGTEVSSKAESCPKCGAVLKRKTGCVTWVVFLGLVFLFVVGYIGSQSTSTTTPSVSGTSVPKLELLGYDWKRGEYGNRYIVGSVRNNTNKQYSYVQVEFNLYDESGAQVGSAMTNVNNLEPSGIWKFEAVVMEDSATKAKFKDVTGF